MSDISHDYVLPDDAMTPYIGPDGLPRAFGGIPRPEGDPTPRSVRAIDMPIYPRHEWPDRIKDRERSKSGLSHIRLTGMPNGGPIPSLDQNGKGYCVTADTDILTARGWVPFPQYDWTTPVGDSARDSSQHARHGARGWRAQSQDAGASLGSCDSSWG